MKKKLLILRFSSIGDIVLTSPVVRCIKKHFDAEIEIHYLTKAAFKPLLEANPYISKLHFFEKNINEILPELLAENFDYVIDLHKNIRSIKIKNKLKCKSYSFPKLNIQKWILVNFKVDLLPRKHIVDRYFEAVAPIGVQNDGLGLDYFIPDEIANHQGLDESKSDEKYFVYAIGGQHSGKILPLNLAVVLCQKIEQKLFLIGGKEDFERGNYIASQCEKNIVNLCGKLTIHQSALLLKNSEKVISHDTGMMHIAAAFKKDIISLWGGTVPEFGMTPYKPGSKSVVIESKNFLRPSSKLGKATLFNPKPMHGIRVSEILKALG